MENPSINISSVETKKDEDTPTRKTIQEDNTMARHRGVSSGLKKNLDPVVTLKEGPPGVGPIMKGGGENSDNKNTHDAAPGGSKNQHGGKGGKSREKGKNQGHYQRNAQQHYGLTPISKGMQVILSAPRSKNPVGVTAAGWELDPEDEQQEKAQVAQQEKDALHNFAQNLQRPTQPAELPLSDTYTLWHASGKKPGKGAKWVKPKPLSTFSTVGDFWRLFLAVIPPSCLNPGADMHLFKMGIEPEWEHSRNVGGGTWTVNLHQTEKDFFDHLWTTLALLLVGQNFDRQHDHVCGIVASVRQRKLRIALWVNAPDVSSVRAIGQILLDACSNAGHDQKTLNYSPHDNTSERQQKISLRSPVQIIRKAEFRK